ncbi:MAG: imidazoleglycerol-phosphate dehydratase HisB [Gammaproteobacteria bacterium]|nr:MAG: imidazoleglycerol-phosphate dehydratase HisB [Gammaproteobacteria bacterium]
MKSRTAQIARKTKETDIEIAIDLDGTGSATLNTGIPFFDHMLDQVSRHGLIDLTVTAKGDLEIDQHHTIEDIGITLGQVFKEAVGDKKGISRYAHAYVPLDEALSRIVIDISGRPALEYHVDLPYPEVGGMDGDLIREFFQAFVNHAGVSLHIDNIRGLNSHHIAETIFKAFGRVLRQAVTIDERCKGTTPSTKGQL